MTPEFDLINQFFKPLDTTSSSDLGIGDDGAVMNCPAGHQLVIVTDTLVKGVHFPYETSAYDIGWKSLAVNLSDLAAMGAEPAFFSLALTLSPDENNLAWLKGFASGLQALSSKYAIPLIGGDTTKGPLSITVTAQGWIPCGEALLRASAKVGDDIYVSGRIGDGGLGLFNVLGALEKTEMMPCEQAILKLNRPEPRIALGCVLRKRALAHAAIDVSDGLLADMTHILKASFVGAIVNIESVPMSSTVKRWSEMAKNPLLALTSGDDYELCFTVSKDKRDEVRDLANELNLPLARIGKITDSDKLTVLDEHGQEMPLTSLGYSHY